MDGREPSGRDPVHSSPVEPCALAAAPQRPVPAAGHLGLETLHRVDVAGFAGCALALMFTDPTQAEKFCLGKDLEKLPYEY